LPDHWSLERGLNHVEQHQVTLEFRLRPTYDRMRLHYMFHCPLLREAVVFAPDNAYLASPRELASIREE
jgi:hypothetical protein